MRKFLAAAGVVAAIGGALAGAPTASAGTCGDVMVGGSGGGWCDYPPGPNPYGQPWQHCETVYVLGFGGTNCFWVRPVPVEVDPRGWVPA